MKDGLLGAQLGLEVRQRQLVDRGHRDVDQVTDLGPLGSLDQVAGADVVALRSAGEVQDGVDPVHRLVQSVALQQVDRQVLYTVAAVVGVSPDKPAAQAKFKQKYDLPFTLLADEDRSAAEAYGVGKEKNMYGKKVMGIERTTFVIGADGKIEKIYNKVKAKGHAEEVLAGL